VARSRKGEFGELRIRLTDEKGKKAGGELAVLPQAVWFVQAYRKPAEVCVLELSAGGTRTAPFLRSFGADGCFFIWKRSPSY
jgi:hypothetical protein